MQLYLTRHGESEANRVGEEAGTDSALTELGWRQAERLGDWLRERGPFDAFYCSPLLRARQTAEVIGRLAGTPAPIVLDSLREATFNLLTVLPQFDDPLDPILRPAALACRDEYDQFRRQVESALEAIVRATTACAHEKVLVVTHGGALGTILRTLVGFHRMSFWSQNCCAHCLAWTDNRGEIRFLNRTDFLDQVSEGR